MCWYCGSPVTYPDPIGRSAKCDDCGKDLRSCKNCRFFMPPDGCKESATESQTDKERANFCDWFSLDAKYRGKTSGHAKDREKAESAKDAFNNLFK